VFTILAERRTKTAVLNPLALAECTSGGAARATGGNGGSKGGK
jgi:hypothetical protein